MTKAHLVLATCVAAMASAGTMASRINHRIVTVYYENLDGTCTTVQMDHVCSTGGYGCTTTIGTRTHVQLFQTVNSIGMCINPLMKGI